MDKKTCKRLLQIAFKTRQNATESAMEYKKVHRTFFIEKKIILCVYQGLRVVLSCDEKCDANIFCSRIIAFYFCIVFFEILIYNYKCIRATRIYACTLLLKI